MTKLTKCLIRTINYQLKIQTTNKFIENRRELKCNLYHFKSMDRHLQWHICMENAVSASYGLAEQPTPIQKVCHDFYSRSFINFKRHINNNLHTKIVQTCTDIWGKQLKFFWILINTTTSFTYTLKTRKDRKGSKDHPKLMKQLILFI